MNTKSLIAGICMTVLAVTGFITLFRAPVVLPVSIDEILNGTTSKNLEDQLLEAIPYKQAVTDYWARFLFTVFNEGKAGVVIGDQGWLYSDEEFQWPHDATQNIQTHTQFVVETVRHLQTANIDVVIIVVPEKIAVYPEFSPQPSAHNSNTLHQRVVRTLKTAKVTIIDPLPQLLKAKAQQAPPLFLRTDTHWTPAGAELVAQHVATELPQLQGTLNFSSTIAEPIAYPGDLMTFIPANNDWLRQQIPVDQVAVVTTSLVADDFADLFATPEPVFAALVGTSYSANATWNFHGFLQQAMALEVLNYAQEGQGPFKPMYALIEADELQAQAITTVFWEIPIRYFVQAPANISVREN